MKKLFTAILLLAASSIFAQNVSEPVSNLKNSYTIDNSVYSVGYCENYGLPIWEMHVLSPRMLDGGFDARFEWQPDSRVKGYRISNKDVLSQKLAPVQLCPKEHIMNDTIAHGTTFLTSNLIFMHRSLKDGVWNRITYSFELLAKQYGRVYLYSGPIYNKGQYRNNFMFNNKVTVPDAFYRIALYFDNGKPLYKCYRIKNGIPTDYERICNLEDFSYNIFQLEEDTDIDFFESYIDSNFRQDKIKFLEGKNR